MKPDINTTLTNKIKDLEGTNHMIAHNLRGAGMNIKMLAEVLMKKNITENCELDDDDDVFTTEEAIQYIHESSTSLLNTLNTLMDAADIQHNQSIKYDDCDIAGVVEYIANQLSVIMQQKKATIELKLAIPQIYYPLTYMESILYNFINNAIKYARSDVPLRIVISTYKEGQSIILSVKDNGIGIDLKVYGRRIFNLYQVFHSGYDSKGVGLYIIKTQIESLGGTVSVKSEVNEGSEFIVVCKLVTESSRENV